MSDKEDKTIPKKLRLFKGGRKRDIYEEARWKKGAVDIDGEQYSGIPILEQEEWYDEELRWKAIEIGQSNNK